MAKRLFTIDEYYRMAEAGILGEKDRVELINGEVLEMSPIGSRHMAYVDRTCAAFMSLLRGKAIVSAASGVELSMYSILQPDIVLLKPRDDYYAAQRRRPADILLVVEVADSSLVYDREVKAALYAIAGIPEFWIEDLQHNALLVYREP
jgi:Uma2 family endonuclease